MCPAGRLFRPHGQDRIASALPGHASASGAVGVSRQTALEEREGKHLIEGVTADTGKTVDKPSWQAEDRRDATGGA